MGSHRNHAAAWWVGGLLLLAAAPAARAQFAADAYAKSEMDLRGQYGIATEQVEGLAEVRGIIAGKISSGAVNTWLVRDESGTQATYSFVADTVTADLPVGTRVRALGLGAANPQGTLRLLAIVAENEMAQWEKAHTPTVAPSAPQPARQPTRVITFPNSQSAALAPSKEMATPRPASRTAPKGTAARTAPKSPAPPRWRDPRGEAPAYSQRVASTAARSQPLTSRGWGEYIQRYTQAVRWFNPRLPLAQADTIARSIVGFSVRYGIDPRLIVAIVAVESNFHINSTSHKGAMGLGQLMPGTAAGLGVRDAYDPVQNIWGAVRLVRGHLKEHSGKPGQLALALASYNAGSGAVKRYGGVPPYRETQAYVRKVQRLYEHLCGYGRTQQASSR